MRRFLHALAVFSVALLGCDKPEPSGGAASAAPSASTPASAAPAPSAAAPAPPPPDNLDVAELQKAMKCASDAKSGPCGVLARFASGCSAWSAVSPGGDGRWFGHGYVVEGSKISDQITLLRSHAVPSSEVGPGQVPAKISVTELPKEEGLPYDQAERTIRIFERDDAPTKANPTIEYIKKRSSWPDFYATRTTGGQVYVIAQQGTYICQGPRKQLFMVQRASTRGASGDGIYAELWAAMW